MVFVCPCILPACRTFPYLCPPPTFFSCLFASPSFPALTSYPRRVHTTAPQTASLDDVSARLRRSERKRTAQATELAEARAEADAARSELSRVLARHRAKEKAAAAAAAQQEKSRESEAAAREKAAATTAGLLAAAAPAQQRQLRERDAEISRLRDRLEAAAGELSEEQVGVESVVIFRWVKELAPLHLVEVDAQQVACPSIHCRARDDVVVSWFVSHYVVTPVAFGSAGSFVFRLFVGTPRSSLVVDSSRSGFKGAQAQCAHDPHV